MFELTNLTDYGLLFMRIMVGAIYFDSGLRDVRDPESRSKSTGLPKWFTIFLAVAELAGAIGIVLGVLQQLAALGLIAIMIGAIQKKIFVWRTGFWGSNGHGWYYDLTLASMLLVVLFTDGGRLVIVR